MTFTGRCCSDDANTTAPRYHKAKHDFIGLDASKGSSAQSLHGHGVVAAAYFRVYLSFPVEGHLHLAS